MSRQDVIDFLSNVQSMREHQRDYFKRRTVDSLKYAKHYEKKVDEFLSRWSDYPVEKIAAQIEQLGLFEVDPQRVIYDTKKD